MILSDKDIKVALKNKDIVIDPFNPKRLKQITYHFTLNNLIVIPKQTDLIDLKSPKIEYEEVKIGDDGYIINPGEFILGQIKERLSLNNQIACQLDSRSTLARIGLNVLQGAVMVNPGTQNDRITLEISNISQSPIKIYPGLKVVKGIFLFLKHESENNNHKYSNQDDPRPKF